MKHQAACDLFDVVLKHSHKGFFIDPLIEPEDRTINITMWPQGIRKGADMWTETVSWDDEDALIKLRERILSEKRHQERLAA